MGAGHSQAQPSSDAATFTNNRRSNWSYNADGQVVSTPFTSTDQPRTMTYDAAGRMLTTLETGQNNTITYSASYDGDSQLVFESSNTSPGTSESSYIVRSTVLGGEVLTRLDQSGNKKITHVPAEGLLFASQRSSGAPGAFVQFTHRNPTGTSETTKAVYDPLGNYLPFQAHGDPRPPVGSYTSASLGGLSASQANPYSSAVGCLLEGIPTTCDRVSKAINRGEAKKVIVDGRGQNPNVALGSMGLFLVEYNKNEKRHSRRSPRRHPILKESDKELDAFDRGKDEGANWVYTLISFQPQNSKTANADKQPGGCKYVNANYGTESGQGYYRYSANHGSNLAADKGLLNYAEAGVVATMINFASDWNQVFPNHPIGIGDLGEFGGVPNFSRHPRSGHAQGRFIDMRPMTLLGGDGDQARTYIGAPTYDRAMTRELIQRLLKTGDVEKILFNDNKAIPEATYSKDHDDHLHVVFKSGLGCK